MYIRCISLDEKPDKAIDDGSTEQLDVSCVVYFACITGMNSLDERKEVSVSGRLQVHVTRRF